MRGFSLIEMLVVIAVTGLMGIALNSMIVNFYRSNTYILESTTALDSAHTGLRDSFEELRQASYGDDGSYPIQNAASSTITFFSDLKGDGSVEKIRIYLQNGTLYQGVTYSSSTPPSYAGQPENTSIIATSVRNSSSTPLFTYYDVDGNQLASSTINVSQISSIAVSLMVDVNPTRAPNVITLMETATLRNLRGQ